MFNVIAITALLCQMVIAIELSPYNQLNYRNFYPNTNIQQLNQPRLEYRSADYTPTLSKEPISEKQNEQTNKVQEIPQPANSLNQLANTKLEDNQKSSQLANLVQQLYMSQAQVQLEATEIQRAQTIAATAQQQLEEAANNVRVISSALHSAQELVATTAMKAQSAQLQLAAHDQILFTARQRVDALSAQMVGLQAEVGIGENKVLIDVPALLSKLKEPLKEEERPKAIPSILPFDVNVTTHSVDSHPELYKSLNHNSDINQKHQEVELQKRSNVEEDDISGIKDDSTVTAEDLRDFLEYVRNNQLDLKYKKEVRSEKNEADPRYISDFLTNIQKNNIKANVVKNNEDSKYRSNEEIINDSIKAVNQQFKKKRNFIN